MSGLIYKNFLINKWSFLFSLITALLCGLVAVLMSIFTGGADSLRQESDAESVTCVFAVLYYLAFMLPSMTTSLLFEADENKTACAFAMSTPQGGKGHVESKYYYILILNIIVMFMLFVCDTITTGLFKGAVSASLILMLFFCWRLFISAIEIPFIIRFGSQRGAAIKGVVVSVLVVIIGIYFLFGDISWLIGTDDPIASFAEWLQSGDITFWISLFPYFAIAAYYISCRISTVLFRKGAESYEQ